MKHHDTPKSELTKAMASRLTQIVSEELSLIGAYKENIKKAIAHYWRQASKDTPSGGEYFQILNHRKDLLRDLKVKEKKLIETVRALKALR